ncbi:ClpP/crotonase [Coccomyxa subellipsoidea C-169]|uniref:ClpP/crotonase n=1 Tax=Coccomyxa subellipsoidea (strain C-169) TaxID=574566 RepID=I0Z2D9_COCSC|nr:ClpP/crotonase [Coccomyxa subellipsoidea C-169]EIE24808.1 ClpP/crotonase [Coccomyxa subellipsoidea C-169]|eukprot:XP_005649352.1 ClpP/crotonase [Coccomyxa subellipsoidea C-169]
MTKVGNYNTLEIHINAQNVATLELSRGAKSNAVNSEMWDELPPALELLDRRDDLRVVVLKGHGRNFCAGIDFSALKGLSASVDLSCPGRSREALRRSILRWQDSLTSLEKCRWPVIAAVQGACVGAGVDMITAADIRYCSADATFCVKEVDLAIVADMGTLQRLPGIVGEGVARELALTARIISAEEAKRVGLVTEVFPDVAALYAAVDRIAATMAAKSPLAITGTKRVMLHSRDMTVSNGLDYVATWNSAQMLSEDIQTVIESLARKSKQLPPFSKL